MAFISGRKMTLSIPPIDHEVSLAEDEFIVSKTSPTGILTYANRTFMTICGYSEPELLGQPHNIIRHPDMPRGVFRLVWNTLKQGDEFFGYVKNRCKDGSFYWVFSNITPVYNGKGELSGYYSARRKPNSQAISQIIPFYQQMLAIEQNHSSSTAAEHSLNYLLAHLRQEKTDYFSWILALEGQRG